VFFSLVFEILVQNKENSLNVKRLLFYFYKKINPNLFLNWDFKIMEEKVLQ